jgi:phosphoglycolate phosphatase
MGRLPYILRMYHLAIFDFDGTLADSFPCFLAALNEAAARYGFRGIDAAEVGQLRGYSSWQVMEHIDVAMWQVPMITQFVRKRMAERIETVTLFPRMHEALEDLAARDVTVAVVSSNSEASIRHVLGHRLASLVSAYRCDVSIFGKRPKLRQVLAATGIGAPRAIAVGDEIRDLKAAHAEGIAFGGVSWGFTAPQALRAADADVMFEHVEDIASLITRRYSA